MITADQLIKRTAVPCKHAVTCQNWAGTGPLLAASAQYRPSAGMFTGRLDVGVPSPGVVLIYGNVLDLFLYSSREFQL